MNNSAFLPLDGFHYDNAVLAKMGFRARKGSPETFDCADFEIMLKRVRRGEADTVTPVFDRSIDLSRTAASIISSEAKFVIVEGNYLLLDGLPWTNLIQYFDMAVYLNVLRSELYFRLIRRWLELGPTSEEAEHRVTRNDMPNVDKVLYSGVNVLN